MMNIYDIQGNVILSVPILRESEHAEELMRTDEVRMFWNAADNATLPDGAYVIVNDEKYSLLEPYTPTQRSENAWRYEPVFVSRFYGLSKVPFYMYTYEGADVDGAILSREADWVLTDNPANFMSTLCRAIKNETGDKYTYAIGADLAASATVPFNSVDIISALNAIANVFKTEFWLEKFSSADSSGNIGKIHLSIANNGETPKVLTVGGNVNVPSITEGREGFYNRFVILGSTRNITQEYRGANVNSIANKRLTLDPATYPGGYIDYSDGAAYTKILVFDGVYPAANLRIKSGSVLARLRYVLDENGDRIEIQTGVYSQYAIYYFKLEKYENGQWSDFVFNNTDYDPVDNPSGMRLPNQKVSIHFSSGPLMGREFELEYHEDALVSAQDKADELPFSAPAGSFEIVKTQEGDYIIPALTGLVPGANDEVILFNIMMPETYVVSAQDRLEAEAFKEIGKNYLQLNADGTAKRDAAGNLLRVDKNSYQFTSNPVAFNASNPGLKIASAVTYVNGAYSLSTRVKSIVTKLDYPIKQTITIGEELTKGTIEELKDNAANANDDINLLDALSASTQRLLDAYNRTQEFIQAGLADDYFELNETLTTLVQLKAAYQYLGAKNGLFFAGASMTGTPEPDLYVKVVGEGANQQRVLYSPLALITAGDQIIGDGTPGSGGGGGGASYIYELKDTLSSWIGRPSVSETQVLVFDPSSNVHDKNGNNGAWKYVNASSIGGVTSVVGQTGVVTAEQIATALTSAGYKLTDHEYTNGYGLNLSNGEFSLTQAVRDSLGLADTALQSASIKTLTLKVGTTTIGSAYNPIGSSNQTLTIVESNLTALLNDNYHPLYGEHDASAEKYFWIGGAKFVWHPAVGGTDGYLELQSAIVTTGDQIVNSGTPGGGGSGGGAGYLYELGDIYHDNAKTVVLRPNGQQRGDGDVLSFDSALGVWVALQKSSLLSGYALESYVDSEIWDSIQALNLGAASTYGVGAVASGNGGLVTGGSVYSAINDAVSSALKFQGITTTAISDGSTTNPIVINGSSYTAKKGDVVLYDGREFLWTGSAWEQLGDEVSWALKTTTISAGTGLTGGGTLAANRTISLNQDSIDKLALAATAYQKPSGGIPNGDIATPWVKVGTTQIRLGEQQTSLAGLVNVTMSGKLTIGSAEIEWVAGENGNPGYLKVNQALLTTGDQIVNSGTPGGGGDGSGAGYLYELGDVYHDANKTTVLREDGSQKQVGDVLQYLNATKGWVAVAASSIGGVTSVVNQTGNVTVTQIADALTAAGYKLTDTVYTLPLAANGTRGGIQIGYSSSGKNYAVQLSSEKAYVNVPWVEYSAGTAANVSGADTTAKVWSGSVLKSAIEAYPGVDKTGTVTSVKVGSTSYNPSSGVVSLPAYPTTLPASDVYAWAKAATKPSYTLDEVTDGSTRKLSDYVLKAGDTMTGDLIISKTGGGNLIIRGTEANHDGGTLYFYGRYYSGNPRNGAKIAAVYPGSGVLYDIQDLVFSVSRNRTDATPTWEEAMRIASTKAVSMTDSLSVGTTLSVTGLATLSGGATIPVNKKLTIGGAEIEWIPNDGNGYLRINKPLLTVGDQIVNSGTPGQGGGGGGAGYLYELNDVYPSAKPPTNNSLMYYTTSLNDKNSNNGAWGYLTIGTNLSISNGVLNCTAAKGDKGDKGDTGPQGPQGPKGEQGNTGSSVDYPYELVNNLTTDDATKGLSAAMGKNIEDRMPAQVDESGWYLADEQLNIALKYDADGLDAAKISGHFIELLKAAGIAGDSPALSCFAFTNEPGFAIVDQLLNVGVKVDQRGIHSQSILEFAIVNS